MQAADPVSQTGPPVGAAYDKVTYDPAFAAEEAAAGATSDPVVESKLRIKRDVNDPCSVNPNGYGPVSDPDTYASFMSDSQFGAIANAAVVPQGYSLSYSNMNGSAQGNGYMGLYTLQSFDTIKCQQYCDAAFSCYAINVYMERDPKYNPADSCPNPQSTTNFKCTLWGLPLTDTGATGQGQYRNQFRIGIRGSNGYSKFPPPAAQNGFDGPVAFGGAIQAPGNNMGSKYYPGVYDPGQCAAACTASTDYDKKYLSSNGAYDACNFFNSFVVSKNNQPQGTYCAMYTTPWDKSYSTNVGQYNGSDYYSVSQSYGYTLNPQDPGTVSSSA
ncbi:MAG: hypothetical protein MMC23_005569 [Stictis urceolatum]|nr:hypothetical protein [Stictis urceolata]